MNGKFMVVAVVIAIAILLLTVGCSALERKLLFYPSHRPADGTLAAWTRNGEIIGWTRKAESPKNVWLMLHGNGGQAADRVYALPSFSPDDAVYILEYPGYGLRAGVPSAESFNRTAKEAYLFLRATFPRLPVCVAAESIGSGPASSLAGLDQPPDKIVLVVPFDRLALVAKDHFPSLLVSLILKDDWDNTTALARYRGPVEIFGAEDDSVIPVAHAKALAASLPTAKFTLIPGGHNEWSQPGRVKIRNP